MQKLVISILGRDCPGIVAAVSKVLFDSGCNVEDVTQTRLQSEFASIFIISMPEGISPDDLHGSMNGALEPLGLQVSMRPLENQGLPADAEPYEPFVITTTGPDRLGLVSGVTEVMALFRVNITNLKALFRGGEDPSKNTMIYEVEIPAGMEQDSFREALFRRAEELGLDLSIQHREIFEAINRI